MVHCKVILQIAIEPAGVGEEGGLRRTLWTYRRNAKMTFKGIIIVDTRVLNKTCSDSFMQPSHPPPTTPPPTPAKGFFIHPWNG